MDTQGTLHAALRADPGDHACWLALADALEEDGHADRAELLRLRLALQVADGPRRAERERRLVQLLDEGVAPAAPLLINSVGMRLALVPAGAFRMGSPATESGRHGDEEPRHAVTLTRPFYLGVCPVTQGEYERVTRHNPSHFRTGGQGAPLVRGMDTSDFPVERVSWDDAAAFCATLSALAAERDAGREYRLPTEAEWEYACRAGTTTAFAFGDALGPDRANVDAAWPPGTATRRRPPARTCKVGEYQANAFGLFDMHGNVFEWCSDWFDAEYYRRSPAGDPPGPATGARRAMRGGAWFHGAVLGRSAYRYRYEADARLNDVGLRVALGA